VAVELIDKVHCRNPLYLTLLSSGFPFRLFGRQKIQIFQYIYCILWVWAIAVKS
jgi:hypothetical protein